MATSINFQKSGRRWTLRRNENDRKSKADLLKHKFKKVRIFAQKIIEVAYSNLSCKSFICNFLSLKISLAEIEKAFIRSMWADLLILLFWLATSNIESYLHSGDHLRNFPIYGHLQQS